jgi:DNA-binding transcriptional ArsR family regulator
MVDDVSIWTALGDSKRRQIINLLEEKPRTTSELCTYFDVSRFAIMKHLKVLDQANLISVKREGRTRWNILNDDLVQFLRTTLVGEDGPYDLAEVLGLFPGRWPSKTQGGVAYESIDIEQALILEAEPRAIFEAWTTGIDGWWAPRSAPESQIRLEPFVNGRFYEALGSEGQGVLYATVTTIKQNKELHLNGTPELAAQIDGTCLAGSHIRIVLEPHENHTRLCFSHHIACGAKDSTRVAFDTHWRVLFEQHFRPFVDQGIPSLHHT